MLMASVISEWKDGCVLVVAHRIELIEQISHTLHSFGIDHGLILRGTDGNDGKSVVVASIQTLARQNESIAIIPSLIIIDEAHHALAKTYRSLWDISPECRFLGLTATPCRLNGQPFTDLFDVLLQSLSIDGFIARGWLSDFDYVSASPAAERFAWYRHCRNVVRTETIRRRKWLQCSTVKRAYAICMNLTGTLLPARKALYMPSTVIMHATLLNIIVTMGYAAA